MNTFVNDKGDMSVGCCCGSQCKRPDKGGCREDAVTQLQLEWRRKPILPPSSLPRAVLADVQVHVSPLFGLMPLPINHRQPRH